MAPPRENVENDIGAMKPFSHGFSAGNFDRQQSVRQHGGKTFDRLAVAVIGTGKFSPHALQGGGQYPILERSAIAQGARLANQDRHVVPRIIDRFAAPIAARMLRNDAPLLAEDDPIGVSVNLDRPANGVRADRVLVIVKANQAGLRDGSRQSVESIEPAAIGNVLRPLLLEHLPNGVLGTFWMQKSLGISDELIGEPSI